MSKKFEAGIIAEKTNKLFDDLYSIYNKYDKSEEAKLIESKFKEISSKDKINIAFVGQYSAGKSTIIKALTGDGSIVIDADIATSSVTNYNWGNVILTDTPGLNTGEHEEHDKMTIEAINNSDLLVYCITSDLFREVTKRDFIKLAENYKSKLFLVINKMNKESGEYNELVKNYSDTINKTIAPDYNLTDFYHFFFDAADYVEGIENNDSECIEESYFESFIEKLNTFIKYKGLCGKLLTPVSLMINSIDDTLIEIEDDEHNKEARKLVQRICKVVEERKKGFVRTANDEVQKLAHKFIQKGNEVASKLGEKKYQFTDGDLQQFFDPLQEELQKRITDCFEKYAEETEEEVNRVLASELAKHFFEEEKVKLAKSIEGQGNNTEVFGKIQQGVGDAATKAVPKLTSFMSKFSNVAAGEKASIWTVRGSDLHKTVLSVGKKFGHKFKPFEALKISKKIANYSKWLGPILTGAGTVIEVIGIFAEKHTEKKLDKAKEDTKILFRAMAEETEENYNKQIESAAAEFDAIKTSLLEEIQKIDDTAESNKELRAELSKTRKALEKLQHDIEYSSNDII